MRVLMVGQAPGRATDPARPMVGGWFDAHVRLPAGLAMRGYLRAFERVNLLGAWPGKSGKGDAFPAREARRAAAALRPRLRGRAVLLMGRGVAAAFGEGRRPYMRWFRLAGGRAAVFPHPSGVSRWWNDPSNRAAARSFLRRLLRRAGGAR